MKTLLRFFWSTVRSVRRALEESPGRTQTGRPADRPALWGAWSLRRRRKTRSWSWAWRRSCWRSVLPFMRDPETSSCYFCYLFINWNWVTVPYRSVGLPSAEARRGLTEASLTWSVPWRTSQRRRSSWWRTTWPTKCTTAPQWVGGVVFGHQINWNCQWSCSSLPPGLHVPPVPSENCGHQDVLPKWRVPRHPGAVLWTVSEEQIRRGCQEGADRSGQMTETPTTPTHRSQFGVFILELESISGWLGFHQYMLKSGCRSPTVDIINTGEGAWCLFWFESISQYMLDVLV